MLKECIKLRPPHGGDVLRKAEEYGISPQYLLDFSSNTNPLGPPTEVLDLIKDHLSIIRFYPDEGSTKLKTLLSEYLGVEKEYLILTNGASELIHLLSHLIVPPVLIPAPTFSEYEHSIDSVGKEKIILQLREEEDFRISQKRVIDELPSCKSLFICNPNNPTGDLLSFDEILNIIHKAQKEGVVVVVDEAFIEFDEKAFSASIIKEKLENLFVIRSMTKFFSIPGLRLGYGVGPKSMIERLEKLRPSWNINIIAQIVGEELIKNKDFVLKTRRFIPKERDFLYTELMKIEGILPYPSFTNFLLVRVPSAISSQTITKRLLSQGILVRDCSSFKFLEERFIRIGVRERGDNLRLLKTLRELLR